jgi:hypothetical protein
MNWPEASFAWVVATPFLKRRQQVLKPRALGESAGFALVGAPIHPYASRAAGVAAGDA